VGSLTRRCWLLYIFSICSVKVRLAKDRKKGDKIVTDSQERAYWRAYRPPPSFLNCLEQPPFPTNSSWISLAPSSNQRDDSAGASCTTASSNFIRKWKNIEEIKTEVKEKEIRNIPPLTHHLAASRQCRSNAI
jgi:hypothetical protein